MQPRSGTSISNVVQAALAEEMVNQLAEFLHTLPQKMAEIREAAKNIDNLKSVSEKIAELKETLLWLVQANVDETMLKEAWEVVNEKYQNNFEAIKRALFSCPFVINELNGLKYQMEQQYVLEGSIANILRAMWEDGDDSGDLTIQLILSIPTRMGKLREEIKSFANSSKCMQDIEELKSFVVNNLKDIQPGTLESIVKSAKNTYNTQALHEIVANVVNVEKELIGMEKQLKRKSRNLVNTLFEVDPSEPRSSRTRYPLRDLEAPVYKK